MTPKTKAKSSVVPKLEDSGPRAFVESEDDTYTMTCECGFTSTGWDKKKLAEERGRQHQREHNHGELMPRPLALIDPDRDREITKALRKIEGGGR